MLNRILRCLYAMGIILGTCAFVNIDKGNYVMLGFLIYGAILVAIGSYGWK